MTTFNHCNKKKMKTCKTNFAQNNINNNNDDNDDDGDNDDAKTQRRRLQSLKR